MYDDYTNHEGCALMVTSTVTLHHLCVVEGGQLVVYPHSNVADRHQEVTELRCLRHDVTLSVPTEYRTDHCQPDCAHSIDEFGTVVE